MKANADNIQDVAGYICGIQSNATPNDYDRDQHADAIAQNT